MSEENLPEKNKSEIEKIERKLTEIDPKIFEGVTPNKKQQIIRSVSVTLHRSHSGPLPAPETLAQYSELIPGGADRIMRMAEKQLDHRIALEKKVVSGQMLQSNIGQFLAFFIGLAALGGATYTISTGHDWSGAILGVGGLTGLVTAFIQGKSHQRKSLEEKKPLTNPNKTKRLPKS